VFCHSASVSHQLLDASRILPVLPSIHLGLAQEEFLMVLKGEIATNAGGDQRAKREVGEMSISSQVLQRQLPQKQVGIRVLPPNKTVAF
jgi:hypothetical protein